MSINDFVEMTIFLCLICFFIYDKMHGFVDECVFLFFFYLFIHFFLFNTEIQDGHHFLQIPCGLKILSKSLYLALFPR